MIRRSDTAEWKSMKPIVLSETEAEALQQYFQHTWLGYNEAFKPMHDLLFRIERYLAEREVEKAQAVR